MWCIAVIMLHVLCVIAIRCNHVFKITGEELHVVDEFCIIRIVVEEVVSSMAMPSSADRG